MLKFPLFLPGGKQEKSAGISNWLMIRLVPSFNLKTKYLYSMNLQLPSNFLETTVLVGYIHKWCLILEEGILQIETAIIRNSKKCSLSHPQTPGVHDASRS